MSPRESSDVLPKAGRCVDSSQQTVEWQLRQLEDFVRDQPLTALAISITAGFLLGGGTETSSGRAALGFMGRLAIRVAVAKLLTGMLRGTHEPQAKDFPKAS
jgi:hypothetical protein